MDTVIPSCLMKSFVRCRTWISCAGSSALCQTAGGRLEIREGGLGAFCPCAVRRERRAAPSGDVALAQLAVGLAGLLVVDGRADDQHIRAEVEWRRVLHGCGDGAHGGSPRNPVGHGVALQAVLRR